MTTSAGGLPPTYRFADLTLDAARRCVSRQGRSIELKTLDFELLRFLVESAPNVVNADVLAEKVWGRHFVSPENVAQRVKLLRQTLADDATRPRYIETVRNKGYRLIPVVERALPNEIVSVPKHRRVLIMAVAALILVAATATYWLTERPPPLSRSVAVLPFENTGADVDDAFFATAMQDEIVSELTKLGDLIVIPVRLGAGGQGSIQEVIRGLEVATVLGGSVHSADGRWRVNTHLTAVATGVSLWSGSYQHERRDSFKIQNDIALDVARALSIELTAAVRERIVRVPTTDPRARELYLTARGRTTRDSPDETMLAIRELEQALELEEFAEALALLSGLRGVSQFYEPAHAVEHQKLAEETARRALTLDPDLAEAHAALGFVLWTKNDWIGAEAAFRKADNLNLYPSGSMGARATMQLGAGNFAVARDIGEKVRVAEPYNDIAHRFLMHAYAGLGDSQAATALYESGKSLFEPWPEGSIQRMHWLVGRGELAEARTLPIVDGLNAAMLASLDASEDALAELRRAYGASGPGNPNHRRDIGVWAGHFGDPDLAFEAMRAAIDEQGGQSVYLWYPQLEATRHLPAFKRFMRDIGLAEYWQEYGWPPFCRPLGEHDFECH